MIDTFKIVRAYLKISHNYSCIMAEFPQDISEKIKDWAYTNISEDILSGDGIENNIHVTIKYGIHIYDFTEIRDLFKNEKPIKMKLGKISLFTSNDDFDVIKIDLTSPSLHRLNKKISNLFEVTDTHSIYRSHCTLAYIKKSFGIPFNGNTTFEGQEVISDTIVFSGKDNRETAFKLLP